MYSFKVKPALRERMQAMAREMEISTSAVARLAMSRGLTIMELEWKQTHGRSQPPAEPDRANF